MRWVTGVLFAYLVHAASALIVSYEGDVYPETAGWERVGSGGAVRSLQDGSFVQVGEVTGLLDAYRRSLGDFAGAEGFFVEWRVQTDAPSSILDVSGTPVALSVSGTDSASYHFTVTDERVRVIRSNFLPIIFVEVERGIPHRYRVELFADESYAWYIDAELVHGGVPEGPYPTESSVVVWGARHDTFEATTRWDYVRYGVIPADASGDYDSDDDVDGRDFYFFHECLTNARVGIDGGPGENAGPACRFADFDADGDVDLLDVAAFRNAFTGGE